MNKLDKAKDSRLKKTYGISLENWQEMLSKQKGVCYICKRMPNSKVLCVDHIHVRAFKSLPEEDKKQYVRGLLCFMCNTALKCIEKTTDGKRNRQMLEGIVRYFTEFKLKGEIQ